MKVKIHLVHKNVEHMDIQVSMIQSIGNVYWCHTVGVICDNLSNVYTRYISTRKIKHKALTYTWKFGVWRILDNSERCSNFFSDVTRSSYNVDKRIFNVQNYINHVQDNYIGQMYLTILGKRRLNMWSSANVGWFVRDNTRITKLKVRHLLNKLQILLGCNRLQISEVYFSVDIWMWYTGQSLGCLHVSHTYDVIITAEKPENWPFSDIKNSMFIKYKWSGR